MDTVDRLRQYHKRRCLISFRREGIESGSIQGFVLAVSEQLVAFQYVYDFRLDGIMIVAVADLTEIRQSRTDRFQHGLLRSDGALDEVPFGRSITIGSWRSAIGALSGRKQRLLIVESERAPDDKFAIGRVLGMTAKGVRFHHFTGIARWEDEPRLIPFDAITCCQAGTNYLAAYERHFARQAASDR